MGSLGYQCGTASLIQFLLAFLWYYCTMALYRHRRTMKQKFGFVPVSHLFYYVNLICRFELASGHMRIKANHVITTVVQFRCDLSKCSGLGKRILHEIVFKSAASRLQFSAETIDQEKYANFHTMAQ